MYMYNYTRTCTIISGCTHVHNPHDLHVCTCMYMHVHASYPVLCTLQPSYDP